MTLTPLSPTNRRRYFAAKKAQLMHLLRRRLEDLTCEDIAALAPTSRARLVEVLDRVSAEIPADLIAQLRVALAKTKGTS